MTPEGWAKIRLEELASDGRDTFIDGDWVETKDQDPNGPIRLFQVGNVLKGKLKTDGNHRWVNDETAKRLNYTKLKEGDLLISRMPDPIGRACLVPKLPYEAITAVDCAILRVDLSRVEPRFVVQYFNSEEHLGAVASHITGTTRQRISRGSLAKLLVLLPPLPEQRKIAAILSSVDEAIDKTQAVIDQLGVVKKAMMQELLTKGLPGRHTRFKQSEIGMVPEEWEVVPLRELLATGPTNGKSPPARTTPPGTPTFSIAAVRQGRVNILENLKYTDVTDADIQRFAVEPGDILIVRGNANPDLIGKCGVVGVAPPSCIYPDILMRARTNQRMDGSLLVTIWNADVVHDQLLLKAKTTNGTYKVNQSDVATTLVPVPGIDEQHALASLFDGLGSSISANGAELDGLVRVKSALMSVVLTGEVRVTPDEDAA
jgi:type I restriction enzyme S subunit